MQRVRVNIKFEVVDEATGERVFDHENTWHSVDEQGLVMMEGILTNAMAQLQQAGAAKAAGNASASGSSSPAKA